MLVLIIILLILSLILLLPVGADACFYNDGGRLKVKAGPVSITLLSLPKEYKPKKPKKAKKSKKDKKSEEDEEPKAAEGHKKKKLSLQDILALVKIGLRALGRFRRQLSVDLLELELTCAGDDPYSTAMSYAYLSAASGTLLPMLHRVMKIRDERIKLDVNFELPGMEYYTHVIATIQIWEVLYIAFAFLFGFIGYKIKSRSKTKKSERKVNNGKNDKRNDVSVNEQAQGDGGRKHRRRKADNIA